MSARGLASGLVQPIARGLVRSATGGGAPWDGLVNIVGMWPLDEASGPAIDASGNGNDLTAFNSPGYSATGGPGGAPCRTSVGTGQYFSISSIENYAAGDFTFVAWDFWNTGVSDTRTMGQASPDFEIILGHLNDALGGRYSNTDSPEYRSYAATSGAWHCKIMRITKATKRCEIFVDNAKVLDVTMAADIAAITSAFQFLGGTSMASKICRLAVTKHLFTDADVAAFSASARDWAYWQAYSP